MELIKKSLPGPGPGPQHRQLVEPAAVPHRENLVSYMPTPSFPRERKSTVNSNKGDADHPDSGQPTIVG